MAEWLFNAAIFFHNWILPIACFLAVCFVMLLPLLLFKEARVVVGMGFVTGSYMVGLFIWLESAAVALILWGIWGLVTGIALFGIGVVPVALLASLFNGQYPIFLSITLGIVIVIGARIIGFRLIEKSDD